MQYDNTATGDLIPLVLPHLPEPREFRHERVLSPDAPRTALRDAETYLDGYEHKGITVRFDGPQPTRILHNGPPDLLVEGLEPADLRYGCLGRWESLLEDDCSVSRVWISTRLASKLDESPEI